MLRLPPLGCGRKGLSLRARRPWPFLQPGSQGRTGGEEQPLGKSEFSPELPGLERGSGGGKASEKPREQMGDCNRAEERRAWAGVTPGRLPAGVCSQTLRPLRLKEERKRGEHWRGQGANPMPPLGTFPLRHRPWGGLPRPRSPGSRHLAWDGDEGHELGSPEPLRYQIRPPASLLHAVLVQPK